MKVGPKLPRKDLTAKETKGDPIMITRSRLRSELRRAGEEGEGGVVCIVHLEA